MKCDDEDHDERFKGVSGNRNGCLVCEIEEARTTLRLYKDLLDRLQPCCEDFHHKPSEYHESNVPCPVLAKFVEILG